MNGLEFFFLTAFFVLAAIGIRMVAKKGFTGAMLGGEVEKTYGKICFSHPAIVSHTFKVHRLIKNGAPEIVLAHSQRTFGGGRITPLKLSKSDATKLAEMLNQAADEL